MYTQGSYLRVLTPRVTNGTNLQIGADGRIDYKEAHLPISAKRKMEEYNRKLPNHLKKVIEVVHGNIEPNIPQPKPADVNTDLLNELNQYKSKWSRWKRQSNHCLLQIKNCRNSNL